jgi:hypothetical protein
MDSSARAIISFFLRGKFRGDEILRAGIGQLVPAFLVDLGKNVVHQGGNHGRLGLGEFCAFQLFQDHEFPLKVSMAVRFGDNGPPPLKFRAAVVCLHVFLPFCLWA